MDGSYALAFTFIRTHGFVAPLTVIALFLVGIHFDNSEALSQDVRLIPIRDALPSQSQSNESIAWSLHMKKNAIVTTPLLRLRDVADPVDRAAPWWERTGNSIIGLMPVGGHEMVIQRSRLAEMLARSTSATDIEWSGPDTVRVTLERPEVAANEKTLQLLPIDEMTSQSLPASIPIEASGASQPYRASSFSAGTAGSGQSTKSMRPMPLSERERIIRLIQYAVDRYDVRLRDAYDIQIDPNQQGIEELVDLRRVDTISFVAEPLEGMNDGKVTGMSSREPVTSTIEVELVTRPLVVVSKEGLRRGHILTQDDMHLLPATRNLSLEGVVTDMSEVIGMQVQTVLQKDRPITRSAVGPVQVITRGDLVEVRVVGGGLTVSTNAKTLADGAVGDLIPIETLEPRKKLMARVAAAGQVEILTRPPRVQ